MNGLTLQQICNASGIVSIPVTHLSKGANFVYIIIEGKSSQSIIFVE